MRITKLRALPGPNIHSHQPVYVMELDLTAEDGLPTETILRLAEQAQDDFMALGWQDDWDGLGSETDAQALRLGRLVAEIAGRLARLAEVPPTDCAVHHDPQSRTCTVALGYSAEHATRYLLETAVEYVAARLRDADPTPNPSPAGRGEPEPDAPPPLPGEAAGGRGALLAECVAEARRIAAETELGPSTRAIVEAAAQRGIPWQRLSEESLVQLGYGKYRRLIQAATTDRTASLAVGIAGDKALTKTLLERAAIPVPQGQIVRSADDAVAALDAIGAPVVVKPLNGRQGKGVSLNLTTPDEVRAAFAVAQELSRAVIVEAMVQGEDYRVLVVDGKLVAASHRRPAHVVGDGAHTVAALIDRVNQDPRRGEGHAKPLTKIRVDAIALACLAKQGYTLDSVPPAGATVYLREGANLSTGGTATDVTDAVHPAIRRLCERAARVVGLDICGLDLVLEDIRRPLRQGNGVIEVNAGPGLRMHLYPSCGQSRPVGEAIVDMLYPPGAPSRIPIVTITGTNGKTTTTRMIGHILGEAGRYVGMTTTDGIWLGGECISQGDTTGPQSARLVLSDPAVDVAVLETARGGIARRGLGYDWADVAVMTNVQPDHIGQDGIRSVEDLVRIKRLTLERVRPGGVLVLNADDPQTARLAQTPHLTHDRQLVLFSLGGNRGLVRQHLQAGGTAYLLRGGWLVEAVGGRQTRLVRAELIPVTLAGAAEFNIANALAAAAATRALGVPRHQVSAALLGFDSARNPGRANLYRVGQGYVLLDYGHNPDALDQVARLAAHWQWRRLTGIVAAPGDRDDSLIRHVAQMAARSFQRILIWEGQDRRGREPGVVAALMYETVQAVAPHRDCRVVLNATEALETALADMVEDEGIVVFYEDMATAQETLACWGATPVTTLTPRSLAGVA